VGRGLLVLCGVLLLAPRPAQTQEAVLDGLTLLPAEELATFRAGLLLAGGIAFEFGAIVRTTVDGRAALETRLTWTPDGVVVEDMSAFPDAPIPEFHGFGLTITDATGTTLVGHRLLDGGLQGFIINTGDNRNIRQDLNVTLTLPGFDAIQRDMLTDRLGFRIGSGVAGGLVRSGLD
jgi:hypothetical protein